MPSTIGIRSFRCLRLRLWARLFDARKESLRGAFDFVEVLAPEVEERFALAGG